MRLYVCWGTFQVPWKPIKSHPCHDTAKALRAAGHDPEIKRTYGLGQLPASLNPGRRPVRELTGQGWVPVLELDDGTTIVDSKQIIAWAEANPAG